MNSNERRIIIILVIATLAFTLINVLSAAVANASESCQNQHYSLKGNSGLNEDQVPVFPADYWQANTEQEPHKNNPNITWVEAEGVGLHYASHNSEGKRDWFYYHVCPTPTPDPTTPTPDPTEPTDEPTTPTPTPTTPSPTPTTESPSPTDSPSPTQTSPDPTGTPTTTSSPTDTPPPTIPVPTGSTTPTVSESPNVPSNTPLPEVDAGHSPSPTATMVPPVEDELAKTGTNEVAWLLLLAGLFSLAGLALKRWSR